MGDKTYYYLKLEETYFNNKIEKALRKLPSGAEMLICYLKMQLKYIRSEGFIIYSGIYETLEEEISLEIDEDINVIKMLLVALNKWGYILQVENGFYLSDMQKRVGSKTDVALRVAKHREKSKMLQSNSNETNVTPIKRREDIEKIREKENIVYENEYFIITEKKHNEYKDTFKNVDLLTEYKKMKLWLDDNSSKRKTEKGYPRFITSWLGRAAEKVKPEEKPAPKKYYYGDNKHESYV